MWCPGCLISKGIWNDIKKIYPNFEYINYDYDLDEEKIEKYNVKDIVPVVIFEKDNIEIKRIIGEKSKDEILKDDISNGVPYTVIGEKYFVGFSDTIKEKIETEINNLINNISEDKDSVKIPLLGKVNMKSVSIPIVAIILGAIDGFNPCAMWILLLLINICITMKDKKKMKIVGFTFIISSALVYFLSMLGIGIILDLSVVIFIRNIIAIFAIILGIYNLYIYIKTRNDTGCHVVKKEKRKILLQRLIIF